MKSSVMLAGVCLLALVFTIAECTLALDVTKREDICQPLCQSLCQQSDNACRSVGICILAALASDTDTFCDNDCVEVFEDLYECAGIDLEDDSQLEELREECGSTGVGAALVSVILAVVVALVATLN